jgi:small-conductance mechanosensitive channel
VQVQVDYASDIEAVKRVLVEVALAHPRVQKEPAPSVLLLRFAENGIDLELGFWITDPESGTLNVRSDLNFAILAAFKRENLSISSPKREVLVVPATAAGGLVPKN